MRCSFLLLVSLLPQFTAPARAESDPPTFAVRSVNGKVAKSPLESLGADWSVELAKGRKIPGFELLSLRQVGVPLPPLAGDEQLILANGDRLPVRDLLLEGERLSFTHPDIAGGKKTYLPLAAVAVYWRSPPDRVADIGKYRRTLLSAARKRDQVVLRNGDLLEGTLNSLDSRVAEVEADGKTRSARINQVAAVALSTELADRMKAKGISARLVLTPTEHSPGGRLTLSGATSDGKTLRGKTVFGANLRVPLERVASLDLVGGRVACLADLTPNRYEYFPFLDERWNWSAGANVLGGDLKLGGEVHDRGIGLHAHSRLSWKVGGEFKAFEALVGLDDSAGQAGRVRVRVLGDGKPLELGFDGELTHANGPKLVRLNVDGVKELTLEVENAPGGAGVQGVVDWVEARLIR